MNLPQITIRAFTSDQFELDKCFYSNAYQLKGFKEEADQPVVLDIGANAGFFSFAAFALGAKKIFALEPYTPNFKQLLKNTSSLGDKVTTFGCGIYTENAMLKFVDPVSENGIFYDFSNIDVGEGIEHGSYPVITLDELFRLFIKTENIDILKINIGYAELEILEGCQSLGRVESICGETRDLTPERLDQFKARMREKGYNEFYVSKSPEEENKFIFLLSKTNIDKHFNIKK